MMISLKKYNYISMSALIVVTALLMMQLIARSEESLSSNIVEKAILKIISAAATDKIDDKVIAELSPTIAGDALIYFAQIDDLDILARLLDAGVAVDAVNSEGANALYVAVAADSLGAASLLLEAGADPLHATDGGTAADLALEMGSQRMIALLSQADAFDMTILLRLAARNDDPDQIARLVGAGANADALDQFGMTALLEAVSSDSTASVDALLRLGADANAGSPDGFSPLGLAVAAAAPGLVRQLLAADADPNRTSGGVLPLTLAVIVENEEIIDLLLEAGADPDNAGEDGARPAAIARMLGQDGLAERLGGTPELERPDLIEAIRQDDVDGVAAALQAGADPNQLDDEGAPAIVLAAAYSSGQVVRMLLDAGADPFKKGTIGTTAFHAAYVNPSPQRSDRIVQILLGNGPGGVTEDKLRMRDRNGRSAFVAIVLGGADPSGVPASTRNPFRTVLTHPLSGPHDGIRALGNTPDADGITPYAAAVMTNSARILNQFAQTRFTPNLVDGVSMQDLARSREAWAALAELPDDRPIPGGLRKGASRDVKMEMQRRLRDWGYYEGAIDGMFGPQSRAAMRAFLKDREKEITSMADASTRVHARRRIGSGDGEATLMIDFASASEVGGASCTWKIVHWREAEDRSTRFIGCVVGSTSAWNANGFGYVEYPNGTSRLRLFGPGGWEGAVEF